MDVILSRMHLVMHSLGYEEVTEEAGQRSMRLHLQPSFMARGSKLLCQQPDAARSHSALPE